MCGDASGIEAMVARLSGLPEALRAAILADCREEAGRVVLHEGDCLFRQGDAADAVYFVVAGRLEAAVADEDGGERPIAEIACGEPVGELGVLVGGTRSASVRALEETELVKLPKAAFERLADTCPEAFDALAGIIRRRLRRDQLAAILPGVFGPLDAATVREIEAAAEWVSLRGGEVLFRQGAAPNGLYFVVHGRLQAVAAEGEDGGGRVLNEIARGESIGEMSVITGEPRSATVRALRDSELAKFPAAACQRLLQRHPQAMRTIARILTHRLRRTEGSLPGTAAAMNIALVPASADVPLGEFAERLAAALSACGPTLHLSGERVDGLLARPGVAQASFGDPHGSRLAAWLNEREAAHRFILYEADRTASAWTRRCVRQADHVLVVAEAAADPRPGEIERQLLDPGAALTAARRSLVLLHPDGRRLPSGTGRWLAGRRADAHYHIRPAKAGDFGRLARCLSGRAVGLALGGGGARGFAHVGVLRALKEAGVAIDLIGGTSMGAVVAALHAMGLDCQAMLRMAHDLFLAEKPYREFTLPMISLIRSRRLDRVVRRTYGDTRIEDLWLSYFCISTDLTAAEMVTHDRGPLWRAVRASSSLPGVFVPVVDEGHLLVDGGVMNNLPGDVMRARCGGRVIVVNVSPEQELSVPWKQFPSPWKLLWDRILRFKRRARVPSILDVLMRTIVASSDHRAEQVKADADLYLHPPVARYGLLEFAAYERITEAGYQYAKERLEELDKNGTLSALTAP